MYNPKTKLPPVVPGVTFATLTRLDGKGVYEFLVNPSTITTTYSATFNEIPILKTSLARLNYNSSSTVVSIPEVKFYTKGNRSDLTKVLEGLKAMTRPTAEGLWLPACRFTWGSEVYNVCYLSEFPLTVTQRIGGKPTEANGSMTLVIAQEGKALAVPKNEEEGAIALTARELTKAKDNIGRAIRSTANTLAKLPSNIQKSYGSTIKTLNKLKDQAVDGTRFLHINILPDGSGEAIAGKIVEAGKQITDTRLKLPKELLAAIDPATYKHTNTKPASTEID